jgi:hypothetical protein
MFAAGDWNWPRVLAKRVTVVVEHPYPAHTQHLSGGRGSAATAYLRPSNLGMQAERWQQSVVVAAGTTASHILRAGIKEMGYPGSGAEPKTAHRLKGTPFAAPPAPM